MIKTFYQAVRYLESFIPAPSKKHPGELGLGRMQYLMDLLDNPQLKYPTIHVGGTSGKGSTATIIASILATKYKVGLHTSPHLVKITERIRILSKSKSFWGAKRLQNPPHSKRFWTSQNDIEDRDFIKLVNKIIPFVDKVGKSKLGAPSYFEIVTAMAFLYFYQEKVDFAVIEVGMGGRFDATNVIQPLVAVITNVGLDHTEVLGDTVEEIAIDKVGIIKPGIQVVSGVRQKSVVNIICAKCKNQSAKLSLLVPSPSGARQFLHHPRSHGSPPNFARGQPATWEVFPWLAFSYKIKRLDSEGSVFDYKGDKLLKNLKIRLLGEHQVENAALAIRVIEILNESAKVSHGFFPPLPNSLHDLCLRHESRGAQEPVGVLKKHSFPADPIKKGLKIAFIPGRLEIVRKRPLVVLDGAHNPDKMKALVRSIKTIFPKKKVTAIIAIKKDKNAKAILRELLPFCYKVIFTKFQLMGDVGVISSYNPEELMAIARLVGEERFNTKCAVAETVLSQGENMVIVDDVKKAVEEAISWAKEGDLILLTGSLYLIGEIKKAIKLLSN